MRLAILDCDGVLLNWRDSFALWSVENKFLRSQDDWNPNEWVFEPQCDTPISKLIEIFNSTYHISKLPPIQDAINGVKYLKEKGYDLKVCTAFSNSYQAMKMREENLNNVFGKGTFTDVFSVPLGSSKLDIIGKYDFDDTVYIEDTPSALNLALDIGYSPNNLFLIPHPYNKVDCGRMESYGVHIENWNCIKEVL